MARIVVLRPEVADQIAAGEVVERPSSVAKELIENSLDAGATRIEIEIEGGGRDLIRVADDGRGMDREDAAAALERHATSKINSSHDLIGVGTFGFRGEALPAIASVSELVLETGCDTTGGGVEATRVMVRGGTGKKIEPAARQRGTTVTVRRIFYNTPARRKFLRAQSTETRAVVGAVTSLALARMDVAFKLTVDGRVRIEVPPAGSARDRIRLLFNRKLSEGLLDVSYHTGPLSVTGFIQRPADAKPSGRKTYIFVNGRPFKDPFLIRAAEAGYRTAIAPGARPTLMLELDIAGDQVDVNVHPAKLEVRFRDRYFVERTVEQAVREALAPVEASATMGGGSDGWLPSGGPDAADRRAGSGPGAFYDHLSLFGSDPATRSPDGGQQQQLLQIFNTFIVYEQEDGISFVDQHSAHERVIYERTMAELRGGNAAAQHLLLPLTVDLGAAELDAIDQHRDFLTGIGFELEPFGGNSIVIHAVPNPHEGFDAQRCFEEIAADLAGNRLGALHDRMERFAATYGCRAAVKAGQKLSSREMQELLKALFACELPPHDVHGRPTIVQLPKEELERRFRRA